jgi:hypothetical protein
MWSLDLPRSRRWISLFLIRSLTLPGSSAAATQTTTVTVVRIQNIISGRARGYALAAKSVELFGKGIALFGHAGAAVDQLQSLNGHVEMPAPRGRGGAGQVEAHNALRHKSQ